MLSTSLDSIQFDYSAQHFKTALRCYIVITNQGRMAPMQLERALWDIQLPFQRLPVWQKKNLFILILQPMLNRQLIQYMPIQQEMICVVNDTWSL